MAFENEGLKKMLSEGSQEGQQQETTISLPKMAPSEKVKSFPFTLEPSVRKKISKLAKENGYKSASAFVNATFKNL